MKNTFLPLTLVLSLLVSNQHLQAQPKPSNVSAKPSVLINFEEPDFGGDAPAGRERGTGSRSVCQDLTPGVKSNITLNALVPQKSQGLTLQASPTLWFNYSYTSDVAPKSKGDLLGQFSLAIDDKGVDKKVVKDLPINFPPNSSNLKVEIPYTLEEGKWYRWYLVVVCNAQDNTQTTNIALEGLIQRVSDRELKNVVLNKKSEELVNLLASKGIWYDALDEAAKVKCEKSSESQSWEALLAQAKFKQEELKQITQAPLLCQQ